jgi:hypothetical protein
LKKVLNTLVVMSVREREDSGIFGGENMRWPWWEGGWWFIRETG